MALPNSDHELESKIQSIFNEHQGNYGYRRIGLELRKKEKVVNHKKLQRIMCKLDLKAMNYTCKSRRFSSYKGKVGKIAKNRISRRFRTHVCLQKLATDLTEFKCTDGVKLYLSPIMDMYNGEILSYGISKHPILDLVMKPLEEALQIIKKAKFRITIHSDQGWHYQHAKWVRTLQHNVFQSMSRKGNCLDNSPMENFLRPFETGDVLRRKTV